MRLYSPWDLFGGCRSLLAAYLVQTLFMISSLADVLMRRLSSVLVCYVITNFDISESKLAGENL
jgi:hypothetical protein